MSYLTLRFVDVGNGIKNVMDLSDDELQTVCEKLDDYGLQISSLGSPLGKTKLLDVDDGTQNSYFPFDEYLEEHVAKACRIANTLNTKLIRGFSFYHPKGNEGRDYLEPAAEKLQSIAGYCDQFGLTFGLEVEANLIGHNADNLIQLHRLVDSEAMVLIFDGANLVTQGYSKHEIFEQFRLMKPALGWIHVKDHLKINQRVGHYVDEEALHQFVPAGHGESGYQEILSELKEDWGELSARLKRRGMPGLFADLEPHLKGGGQFGGYSGPDGFGIAARAFHKMCCENDVSCPLLSSL